MSAALTELLPCPFCGGPVDLERASNTQHEHFGTRKWWGVVCRNTLGLGGTCAIEQRPSASEAAAIERWNTRVTAAPLPVAGALDAERAGLKAAIEERFNPNHSEHQREVWRKHARTFDALIRQNVELQRTYDERGKQIERLDIALASAQQAGDGQVAAVPEGWKLVPLEPDDAQQMAGATGMRVDTTPMNKIFTANRIYRDMIAAAPLPPVAPMSAEAPAGNVTWTPADEHRLDTALHKMYGTPAPAPLPPQSAVPTATECGVCHGSGWVSRDADIGTEPQSAAQAEDAARYRWIRNNALMGYPSAEGSRNKDAYLIVTGYGYKESPSVVDEAVDAAIAKSK